MELSAFSVVDDYPPGYGEGRDRLHELLELGDACEAAGLSRLWIAEHHFHPGGLCPSPALVLSAIGQRTRRLRLGTMVTVLPFHAPVEAAEELALLDRLTSGRLDLGLGSGYLPIELEAFGLSAEEKRARFDRAYATLLAAFRGEEVSVDPPRTPGVRLNVRPLQSPHPPIWIAVQRREALPHVARRGAGVALIPYATVGNLQELSEEIAEYRAALAPDVGGHVSVAVHVYAGPRPQQAREALQRYLDARLATQSTHYAEKVARDPAQKDARTIETAGFALFGSPDEVAERLTRFASAGADEVMGIFDFGGLDASEAIGSVRKLGALQPPGRGV